MTKGRITYRFVRPEPPDGPEKPPVLRPPGSSPSAPPESAVIPLFRGDEDEALRSAAGRSAWEEEADRIERLILESGSARGLTEPGAGGDAGGGEPEAFTGPARADSVVYRRVPNRAKRTAVSLLMSGLGAVLTGVLLGSFVIQFFRAAPVPSAPPAGVGPAQENAGLADPLAGQRPAPAGGDGPDRPEGTGPDGAGPAGETARLLVLVPERTYYVVQNGVFSTREGAEAAAELLRDKGYAGAVVEDGKLAVFAGMADDRDDALLIARRLEADDLEVYIKPVVLPALDASAGGIAGSEAVLHHAAESRKLMDLVLDVVLGCMNGAQSAGMPEAAWRELQEAHRIWTERAQGGMAAEGDGGAESAVRAADRAVAHAMAAFERYAKDPSEAYLWQVQTALLEHLAAQMQIADLLSLHAAPGAVPAEPAGIAA